MTNYERIKSMSKEEFAQWLQGLTQDETVDISCYGCCNYGTHHYEECDGGCDRCYFYGIGEDIMKYLDKEENKNDN